MGGGMIRMGVRVEGRAEGRSVQSPLEHRAASPRLQAPPGLHLPRGPLGMANLRSRHRRIRRPPRVRRATVRSPCLQTARG